MKPINLDDSDDDNIEEKKQKAKKKTVSRKVSTKAKSKPKPEKKKEEVFDEDDLSEDEEEGEEEDDFDDEELEESDGEASFVPPGTRWSYGDGRGEQRELSAEDCKQRRMDIIDRRRYSARARRKMSTPMQTVNDEDMCNRSFTSFTGSGGAEKMKGRCRYF